MADELIATGHVVHPWLGVETSDLTPAQSASLGTRRGAHRRRRGQSPAEQAGLLDGDVVVSINGAAITSSAALVVELRSDKPKQKVSITYVRDGTEQVTIATLVDRSTGS